MFNDVQLASGLFGGKISFPLLVVLCINRLSSSDPPQRQPQLLPTGRRTFPDRIGLEMHIGDLAFVQSEYR